MGNSPATADEARTASVLSTVGRNIRSLRIENGLTLQALADRTGLSPSMLSLLERGKTGPSIGTLVTIATALGAQIGDLLDRAGQNPDGIVSRHADQPVIEAEGGVRRRLLKHDRTRNIEIAASDYPPGASSAPEPHGHEGYDYGIVLDGVLDVTVSGETHSLQPGDLIAYPSPLPHRFTNPGSTQTRMIWINLRRN